MPRKPPSLEQIQEIFKKEGWKLLSTEYINNSQKLETQCSEGHFVQIKYENFKRGKRCKQCSDNKQRYNLDDVKILFETYGYQLLDTEYKNSKIPIKIKCPANHIIKISYSHFNQGVRCKKCKDNNQRYSLEYIKEEFSKEGYIILDKIYVNSKTKLNFKCNKGHFHSITWADFNNGYRCSYCSGNHKPEFDYVKQTFENLGYLLLEDNYVNSQTKMKFWCQQGNHEHSISWSFLISGVKCGLCSISRKKEIDFIIKQLYLYNYILLDDIYINSNTPMSIQCNYGHITNTITWDNFKQGSRCSLCTYKNEQRVRDIFDHHFNNKFIKCKPDWLGGLELDGYCEELKIAFEYNGEQHYEYIPYFHKNGEDDFENQLVRDTIKEETCKHYGIKLYVVPYYKCSDENILEIIKNN